MSNKTTFLCGYYGMKNTGDDALLLATAWGCQNILGESRFRVTTPRSITLPGFTDIKPMLAEDQWFRGQNRLRQYSSAILSNRVVFGGGSVLHNSHDINLKRHLIKLSSPKSALALGVGIGPFKDVSAEKHCARLINECKYVGVRDRQSYDLARAIAPQGNVHLTFDLAPLLLLNDYYKPLSRERQGICVSLCPHERFDGNEDAETNRIREMAEALKRIYSSCREPITFLDFNGHHHYGDHDIHKKLIAMLSDTVPSYHLHYQTNPLSVINRLSGFKLVISMRLHGAIMGFLAETPVISLNYHRKCSQWCEQAGLPEMQRFEASNIDIDRLTSVATHGLENGFESPELSVKRAIKKSLLNWRIYNEACEANLYRCHTAI